jgi:hypothetical protein
LHAVHRCQRRPPSVARHRRDRDILGHFHEGEVVDFGQRVAIKVLDEPDHIAENLFGTTHGEPSRLSLPGGQDRRRGSLLRETHKYGAIHILSDAGVESSAETATSACIGVPHRLGPVAGCDRADAERGKKRRDDTRLAGRSRRATLLHPAKQTDWRGRSRRRRASAPPQHPSLAGLCAAVVTTAAFSSTRRQTAASTLFAGYVLFPGNREGVDGKYF